MAFELRDLESALPADIVRKGLDYFSAGLVHNLAKHQDNWAATVEGTTSYRVEVKLQDEQVQNWFCDCPYDWGPLCKHVAAVLFAIRSEQQERALQEMPISKGQAKRAKSPRKSPAETSDTTEQIIAQLPEEDMREILRYLSKRENQVRSYLLSKYADLLTQSSRQQFQHLVRDLIKTHTPRQYGFIDYASSNRLGAQLYRLISETSGEWPTIYLCEAVIRQAIKAILEADDSSGAMGGAIDLAFERLYELASNSDTSSKGIRYLYDLGLREHEKPQYKGYDWEGQLRRLAAAAVRNPKQARALINVLERYIAEKSNSRRGDLWAEEAAGLKLELLQQWEEPEAARRYLAANLEWSSFRSEALKIAWEQKRYDEVEQLARDGIELDTKNQYPGLVNKWKNWLIRWAEATGKRTEQIGLIEDMYLRSGDIQYFRRLKELFTSEAFAGRIEHYLQQFQQQRQRYGGGFDQRSAAIYEEEGRLSDLMDLLAAAPSLDLLDHYRSLLAADHQIRYLESYEQGVRNKMEHSSNRQAYRDCCRYLNQMIKMGGREQVRQIVGDWQQRYPRRRAMLEELAKIRF